MPTGCVAAGCAALYHKSVSGNFPYLTSLSILVLPHRLFQGQLPTRELSGEQFSLDPTRIGEWITHMLCEVQNVMRNKLTFLCSKHFASSCFDLTGQTTLRIDTVPLT
ncbi:LOW QUALITY PROTEIN: THAP domain-containing protein 2 [Spheniscus humboldti]